MTTAAMASSPSPVTFDVALQHSLNIPSEFIWPDHEKPTPDAAEELNVPLVDLGAYLHDSDPETAHMVYEACRRHGFFQVVNHGIDEGLISAVHGLTESFFSLATSDKQKAQRRLGESFGYASSFMGRFSSKLPWKETLSFRHRSNTSDVVDFFVKTFGDSFRHQGEVYGKYCEAMAELSLAIMKLLGESLGAGSSCLARFFQGHDSIMRLNYYPSCQRPNLTLGTGPHCDPTALTILHQDQVAGLQVFDNGRWMSIPPKPGAFVVNIGDTFVALSNGRYKSCLHRAVVNSERARKSLAYFLCPEMGKVVTPPEEMMTTMGERAYPDFSWSELLDFTQRHYRADANTLKAFANWLGSRTT